MIIEDQIKKYLGFALKVVGADKRRAAATVSALPVCFEYGVIGTKAYAKPNISSTRAYLKYLQELWREQEE